MKLVGWFLLLSLSLVSSSAGAQDAKATKFRGFYIGMPKADAIALSSSLSSTTDKNCRSNVDIDHPSQTVAKMSFEKCFFGAIDMSDDQFAQEIVNHYGVPSLECETKRIEVGTLNRIPQYEVYKTCKGFAKNDGIVQITGGRLSVERRLQKPSFD